jgi:hypothetical protein
MELVCLNSTKRMDALYRTPWRGFRSLILPCFIGQIQIVHERHHLYNVAISIYISAYCGKPVTNLFYSVFPELSFAIAVCNACGGCNV